MRTASRSAFQFALVAGLSLVMCQAGATQACRSGAVALEARASLLLPASNGVGVVAASASGALALWSPGGALLLVDRNRVLTQATLPDTIMPIGMTITPDGLRMLDQVGRDLLRRPDGTLELLGVARFGMAAQLDAAVWREDGWLVGLRDLVTRTFLLRRLGKNGPTDLFRSARSDSIRTIERYHLTESSRGLLLTRTMAPFAVLRIDPASGAIDTLEALGRSPAFDIPADSLVRWRALPAVALDCTLLLTLTDLTADRRLLVRYGAGDRVEQVTPLDAPLGLITRLPGQDGVLAARRAGELELVWYDWHWVREPSSSIN